MLKSLLFLVNICFISKVVADRQDSTIVKRAVEADDEELLSSFTRLQIIALKDFQKDSGLTGKEFWKAAKDMFGSTVLKLSAKTNDGVIERPIDHCPMTMSINCTNHIKYRTSDGTCNNLDFPLEGSSARAYSRMVKPDYYDEIQEPRRKKNGSKLPSARLVSVNIHEPGNIPLNSFVTIFHVTFGQFLSHDIADTFISQILNEETGTLSDYKCLSDGCNTTGSVNKECFPIPVPDNDPIYPSDKTCIKMVRNGEIVKENCDIGSREQPNRASSWLDGSQIYGFSKAITDSLKSSDLSSGKMETSQHPDFPNWKPFMPTYDVPPPRCVGTNDLIKCFRAGEGRTNSQPALIGTQTLFLRLHNKFAEEFRQIKPHWDGETIFQESKRLLNAVWQNMVFQQYLPLVLGPDIMKKRHLTISKPTKWKGYNPTVTANLINAFSAAAFRFGHSQLPDKFKFTTPQRDEMIEVGFSDVVKRPESVWIEYFGRVSSIDAIMHAQAMQESANSDRHVSNELKALLGMGTDVAAKDNNRGRDHGIPSYLEYRELCGLPVADDFDSLHDLDNETKQSLFELYGDVADIDLFAGGMSETPVPGGMLGPVFGCIIGQQFQNLKLADRFWFENHKAPKWAKLDDIFQETKFSKEQIENIQLYTTGRLYCDCLDEVDTIQPNAMLQPLSEALRLSGLSLDDIYAKVPMYKDNENRRVTCDNHPGIDFSLWM